MATAKKTTTKKASPDETSATGDGPPESLDQVRDILFGAQMRTVDRRLQQLEERLQREADQLRKDLERKIENLEQSTGKANDSLLDKLDAESNRRNEDLAAQQKESRESFKAAERARSELEQSTGVADAELRDQLLKQGEALTDQIEQLATDLRSSLDDITRELRGEKTDTASLVELFTDVAQRLASTLPGADEE